MAGKAVSGFGEYPVDVAARQAIEHSGKAGALIAVDPGSAADRIIGKDTDNLPAFAFGMRRQQRYLIIDRARVLQVTAEASI